MLTILLPAFNSEEYVSQSIQSILNQTYTNFEFLIVDDGSTDNTAQIVQSFSDKRIKYVFKEHSGLASSLNYGLKIAKYDWVARMDSDDISHPLRFEQQIQLIDTQINKVIFSKAAYFIDNRVIFDYATPLKAEEIKKDFILHSPISHPSVIYNRKFILGNGGYNEGLILAEDYDLWLRLKDIAEFVVVDQVLMFCRNDLNSLSRNNEKITNLTIYKIQEDYYRDLEKNFNITKPKEHNIFRGWREYFFGNPKFAKKYWLKNISSLLYPRILLAFIITFLPSRYIDKFKKTMIKLRLRYLIYNYLGKNKEIQKRFDKTLKIIQAKS